MFATWGRILAAHRRLVAALAALSLLLALGTIIVTGPKLSSEGFTSNSAESARVQQTLTREFGQGSDALVFLFDTKQPVSDSATQRAVEAALQPLAGDPHFDRVLTTWSTNNPGMIATGGHATYAVAMISPRADPSDRELQSVIDKVTAAAKANGLTVTIGGNRAVELAATNGAQQGVARAETFTLPLTLLLLILVFGSLLAAGLPLLVSLLAIVAALSVVFALSHSGFQSVFAVNVITTLGLGLGVDYSLFMVSRFREEIARRPMEEALAVTMATVGKVITFSGLTVIFGLAATQFFPLPAVRSIGQAAMIVTALALIYGLTLLPALLAMLGPNVNRLSLSRRRARPPEAEGRVWHGIAQVVMRYPLPVLVALITLLVVFGLPFRRLDITPGGPEVLPANAAARVVSERLVADFPAGDAEPIPVIVTMADSGNPSSAANATALRSFVARLVAIPRVTGVDSFASPALSRATAFDWSRYHGDPATLPQPIAQSLAATVRGDQALIEVSSNATGATLEQVVREIRGIDPSGLTVAVGGDSAQAIDTVDGIKAGIVPAAIFVLVGAYLILFLAFGSVFLPLKAIFMTLLSISASLGALVFVFQDGHLEHLLGFQASGQIISITPIFTFCFLFGLSMDYEVLMLSRIQEIYERTGDNQGAVAHGLAQTGRIITGAAAIMVVAFGGFLLADIVIIKSLGFGLALAVLIDATLVRALLVPATMRLMGRWNWWAPRPVQRLIARLGLAHHPALPESAGAD